MPEPQVPYTRLHPDDLAWLRLLVEAVVCALCSQDIRFRNERPCVILDKEAQALIDARRVQS